MIETVYVAMLRNAETRDVESVCEMLRVVDGFEVLAEGQEPTPPFELPENGVEVVGWTGVFPPNTVGPKGISRITEEGVLFWFDPRSFAEKVADKKEDINRWSYEAINGGFEYGGKRFETDDISRRYLDGTNGCVTVTGAFPPNFPYAWKAEDNSYVSIPDVATWSAFYYAMAARGAEIFMTTQALKNALASCTEDNPGAIDDIVWPS